MITAKTMSGPRGSAALPIQDKPFPTAHAEIDLKLAVLRVVAPEGTKMSHREIAEICGCSRSLIWNIEQQAMKKLRHRVRQTLGLSLGEFLTTNTEAI